MISWSHCDDTWLSCSPHYILSIISFSSLPSTALTFENKPCPCHLSLSLLSLAINLLVHTFSLCPSLASSIILFASRTPLHSPWQARHTLTTLFVSVPITSSTKAPHASHQFSNPRPIEAHAPPSHLDCPLLPPTPT
jgi:hypothetical protein